MLTAEPLSPSAFRIVARLAERSGAEAVMFRIQPMVKYGQSVRVQDRPCRLGDQDWSVDGARTLAWGRIVVTFDAPARVWWPMRGHNSYSADNTYRDLTSARLIAEVAMTPADPTRTLQIDIAD